MEYEKRVLPNGVRVLVSEMPEARSASLAVFVGAGSRMEDRSSAGTGHFLEHIVFKGTAKRPTAANISQDIESRGGAVNAATDKEVTVFWSRLPARHWRVALDVIADLIRAPMLRPVDVDSEKRVVIEDLHASIYHMLGISPKLAYEIEKRPFYVTRDGEGKPINDLFC